MSHFEDFIGVKSGVISVFSYSCYLSYIEIGMLNFKHLPYKNICIFFVAVVAF